MVSVCMRRQYTSDEKCLVLELRKQGVKMADISVQSGVPLVMVKKWLKKARITVSSEVRSQNAANKAFFDYDKLKTLRQEGKSEKEIAEIMGVSKNQIIYRVRKVDAPISKEAIVINKTKYGKALVDEVCNLRTSGLSMEAIANRVGVSFDTTRYLLGKQQITITKDQHKHNMLDYPQETINKIIDLRTGGCSLREVLNSIPNITKGGIKHILRRNSIMLSKEQAIVNAQTGKLIVSGFDSREQQMVFMAAKRGGEFIGPYQGYQIHTQWKCAKGHIWSTTPSTINLGAWCPTCSRRSSKGQLELFEFIKLHAPDATYNDRSVISPKELDIYVPSKNFGVEYNGLFWHSSASPGYKAGAHQAKAEICREKGIRFFAIYEDEWANPDKQDLIKSMIEFRLGAFNGVKLNARDLELRFLKKNREFAEFFSKNHLDGHTKASYAYGLFYQDQLVACASFRVNFNGQLEVARLATKQGYSVRGAAGKLLSPLKNLDLWSYSNNRVGTGEVYRTLGFQEVQRKSVPSYYYTDGQVRIWRFRCRRDNRPEVLAQFPTEAQQALGGVFSQKIFSDSRPLWRIEDYGHRLWFRPKSFKSV